MKVCIYFMAGRQLIPGLIAFAGLLLVASASATTTERIVTDPVSGLAIYGYDPVAYFTKRKATIGHKSFELRHGGAVWRFANSGNRSAFHADPNVYMPRYGGYGALSMARGFAATGDPTIWHIRDDRLYLFFSTAHKTAWKDQPEFNIDAATHNWPIIRQKLVR